MERNQRQFVFRGFRVSDRALGIERRHFFLHANEGGAKTTLGRIEAELKRQ
jgi:hypothetical protein